MARRKPVLPVLDQAGRLLLLSQQNPLSAVQEMRLVTAMQRTNRELADEGWEDATFPVKNFQMLASAGLMGLTVPTKYGGMGASIGEHVEALYELAIAHPGVALAYCMSTTVCAILAKVAPERLRRQILPEAARGGFISSATSEPGLTLQAAGSKMKATFSPAQGGYRYNGVKWFCSGAPYAQSFSAMGRIEGTEELMLAIIPARAKGVDVISRWADGNPLGMRETASDTIKFSDVFVPHDMVVCKGRGFLPEFRRFALGYAAIYGAVGAAALQYIEGIMETDKGKANRFQDRVREMTLWVISSEQAWKAAAEALKQNDPLAAIKIAEAKLACVENSLFVLVKAMGIEGGVSIFGASPLSKLWRQIAPGIVQPPSSERCQWLLDEHAEGRLHSLLEIM